VPFRQELGLYALALVLRLVAAWGPPVGDERWLYVFRGLGSFGDIHPPLFYLLMTPAQALLGNAPQLVLPFLTAAGAVLAARVGGVWLGLMVAASPALTVLDGYARPQALAPLAFLAGVLGLRKSRPWLVLGSALVLVWLRLDLLPVALALLALGGRRVLQALAKHPGRTSVYLALWLLLLPYALAELGTARAIVHAVGDRAISTPARYLSFLVSGQEALLPPALSAALLFPAFLASLRRKDLWAAWLPSPLHLALAPRPAYASLPALGLAAAAAALPLPLRRALFLVSLALAALAAWNMHLTRLAEGLPLPPS